MHTHTSWTYTKTHTETHWRISVGQSELSLAADRSLVHPNHFICSPPQSTSRLRRTDEAPLINRFIFTSAESSARLIPMTSLSLASFFSVWSGREQKEQFSCKLCETGELKLTRRTWATFQAKAVVYQKRHAVIDQSINQSFFFVKIKTVLVRVLYIHKYTTMKLNMTKN